MVQKPEEKANQELRALEAKVSDVLLAFIDFLYAVVFGLIVAEAFERIVFSEQTYLEKTRLLLLVLAVFYFLVWDWLHGRILTIKNPYKSYRRFFTEIVIAFCGYGAAYAVVHAKVSFLIYIILILFLGARWASDTIKEHPDSDEKNELYVIGSYQVVQAAIGALTFTGWYLFSGGEISLLGATYSLLLGWVFIFQYELLIPRPKGISGGPGVPFVSKERMDKTRILMVRFLRYFVKR